MTAAFVAYSRVSTDRQGRSGLGLEAQREAISARTRAALAVARARGTRLGNPNAGPARTLAAAGLLAKRLAGQGLSLRAVARPPAAGVGTPPACGRCSAATMLPGLDGAGRTPLTAPRTTMKMIAG